MMEMLASWERNWERLPHPRIATGLTAVLVIVAAILLARITWLLWPRPEPAFVWQPQVATANPTMATSYDAARDVALFGKQTVAVTPVVRPTVNTDAPKTTLSLTLTGLVSTDIAGRSAAIIAHRGKQATYGVGDQIEGASAVVRQVLRDRVIIANQGREETLMLDGEEYRRLSEANGPRTAPPRREVGPGPSAEAAARLRDYQSELRRDPVAATSRITDYLRISPVRENNEMKGWRVNPGKDPALFQALGLKPNDLVTAMNGVDLTNMNEAMAAMKQLGELNDVSLTVVRDEQQYEILFSLPAEGSAEAELPRPEDNHEVHAETEWEPPLDDDSRMNAEPIDDMGDSVDPVEPQNEME